MFRRLDTLLTEAEFPGQSAVLSDVIKYIQEPAATFVKVIGPNGVDFVRIPLFPRVMVPKFTVFIAYVQVS